MESFTTKSKHEKDLRGGEKSTLHMSDNRL